MTLPEEQGNVTSSNFSTSNLPTTFNLTLNYTSTSAGVRTTWVESLENSHTTSNINTTINTANATTNVVSIGNEISTTQTTQTDNNEFGNTTYFTTTLFNVTSALEFGTTNGTTSTNFPNGTQSSAPITSFVTNTSISTTNITMTISSTPSFANITSTKIMTSEIANNTTHSMSISLSPSISTADVVTNITTASFIPTSTFVNLTEETTISESTSVTTTEAELEEIATTESNFSTLSTSSLPTVQPTQQTFPADASTISFAFVLREAPRVFLVNGTTAFLEQSLRQQLTAHDFPSSEISFTFNNLNGFVLVTVQGPRMQVNGVRLAVRSGRLFVQDSLGQKQQAVSLRTFSASDETSFLIFIGILAGLFILSVFLLCTGFLGSSKSYELTSNLLSVDDHNEKKPQESSVQMFSNATQKSKGMKYAGTETIALGPAFRALENNTAVDEDEQEHFIDDNGLGATFPTRTSASGSMQPSRQTIPTATTSFSGPWNAQRPVMMHNQQHSASPYRQRFGSLQSAVPLSISQIRGNEAEEYIAPAPRFSHVSELHAPHMQSHSLHSFHIQRTSATRPPNNKYSSSFTEGITPELFVEPPPIRPPPVNGFGLIRANTSIQRPSTRPSHVYEVIPGDRSPFNTN